MGKLDKFEKGVIIFLMALLFLTIFKGCEVKVNIDSKPSPAVKSQY
jgi:hypothetical protein